MDPAVMLLRRSNALVVFRSWTLTFSFSCLSRLRNQEYIADWMLRPSDSSIVFSCSGVISFICLGRSVTVVLKGTIAMISCDAVSRSRSEEHTSELQSRENLVCRLLLEKKNKKV